MTATHELLFTRRRGDAEQKDSRKGAEAAEKKRIWAAQPPISFFLRASASPREPNLCGLCASARIFSVPHRRQTIR